jgi:hypothetical protein
MERRRFPVGASPARQPLQPEVIGLEIIEEEREDYKFWGVSKLEAT